ncbi:hypothetical protein Q5752_005119 [Cryptotrichosporon argae]
MSQAVCRDYLAGHCRYGASCRFYHPPRGGAGVGVSSSNATPLGSRPAPIKYQFNNDTIRADLTVERPIWYASTYAAAKHEPSVLNHGQDVNVSMEEMRWKSVMALQSGAPADYVQFEQTTLGNAKQNIDTALVDINRTREAAEKLHDVRYPNGVEPGMTRRPTNFDEMAILNSVGGSVGAGAASPFGAPMNPFGAPAATSTFGSAPSTSGSAFGSSGFGSSSGSFGKSAFGLTPAAGSPFGAAAGTSSGTAFGNASPASSGSAFGASAFGQKPGGSAFGGTTGGSAFGSSGSGSTSTTLAFGANPAASTSAFGSTPTPAGSAFGSTSTPAAGFPFASTVTPAAGSAFKSSGFGASQSAGSAFGSSGFGAKPAFGSSPTTTAPTAGGFGQSAFGKPATAFGASAFGQQAGSSTSAAGAATGGTSPFGVAGSGSANPFGAPMTTTSAFGQAAAGGSSPFGAGGTAAGGTSPFGAGGSGTSAFGTSPSISVFGQTGKSAFRTSAFGAPATAGSAFGSTPPAPSAFGSGASAPTSTFDTAAPRSTTSPFRAAPATGVAGQAAFGQPQPAVTNAFGTPTQGSAFGALPATGSAFAGFGSAASPSALAIAPATFGSVQAQVDGAPPGWSWDDPWSVFLPSFEGDEYGKITDEEKRALEQDSFELGGVPLVPPPPSVRV